MNRFVDAMVAEGLTIAVTRFPEGTRTAQDAAAAIGCDVAAIVKSLVFVVERVGPVLALTSGANRVDADRLGAHFAGTGPARQAKPDEARAATGYAIGGTPPFGVTNLRERTGPRAVNSRKMSVVGRQRDIRATPRHLVEE